MKIAICISGQARAFESCYFSFKKYFLDYYDCDVYIQTYKEKYTDKYIKLYNPKKFLIEEPIIDFDIHPYAFINKFPETNTQNMFWMFRNIYKCFNLIEDEYDFFVRTRSDLLYEKSINFELLSGNKIFIPVGGDYRNGIFDMFSVSTRGGMKIYSDLFLNINQYISNGIKAHPETLLKHHLFSDRVEQFQISRFLYPIKLMRVKNDIVTLTNPIFLKNHLKFYYYLKSLLNIY